MVEKLACHHVWVGSLVKFVQVHCKYCNYLLWNAFSITIITINADNDIISFVSK